MTVTKRGGSLLTIQTSSVALRASLVSWLRHRPRNWEAVSPSPALGMKPARQTPHEESADVEADHSGYVSDLGFRAFSGSGNRLDGKKKGVEPNPSPIKPGDIRRGIPNYDFKIGKITFIRNSRPLVKKIEEDDAGSRFIAFSGEGQSLRKKGRKP